MPAVTAKSRAEKEKTDSDALSFAKWDTLLSIGYKNIIAEKVLKIC